MNDWNFAIFKYSRDSYDPDEWNFPGRELFNGDVRRNVISEIFSKKINSLIRRNNYGIKDS